MASSGVRGFAAIWKQVCCYWAAERLVWATVATSGAPRDGLGTTLHRYILLSTRRISKKAAGIVTFTAGRETEIEPNTQRQTYYHQMLALKPLPALIDFLR